MQSGEPRPGDGVTILLTYRQIHFEVTKLFYNRNFLVPQSNFWFLTKQLKSLRFYANAPSTILIESKEAFETNPKKSGCSIPCIRID
jgi:hypothetical protein